jgi:hypothetical protein
MVKFQPSKLAMRVRFPLPAFCILHLERKKVIDWHSLTVIEVRGRILTLKRVMKKLIVAAIGRVFSSRLTRSALLPVLALGLGLAFWTATAAPPTSGSPRGGGHQPCTICHTAEANPHEITIDCNALEQHLRNHPEDRAGPCPKASPTPTPTASPTASPSPTASVPPGHDKCEVCHNPHNYHTIRIPCKQVDKFLENHPGDFRGPCEVTPVTNP